MDLQSHWNFMGKTNMVENSTNQGITAKIKPLDSLDLVVCCSREQPKKLSIMLLDNN